MIARRLAVLALVAAAPLAAQDDDRFDLRVRLQGINVVHQESGVERQAEGTGGGAALMVRYGRVALEVSGFRAELVPEWDDGLEYDMLQGDVRLSVLVWNPISIEIGSGRRDVDPELAAPSVGYARVGASARTPLSSLGDVTLRGAFLAPEYDGGGERAFSMEVSLAASVGLASGLIRIRGEYDFQRFGRTVNDVKLPLQVTVARVGVDVGF